MLWQEVDASVERVLDGGTSCVACYGQTGSGKTYSMVGGPGQHAGVQPRSICFLLDQLDLLGIEVMPSETAFEDRLQHVEDAAEAASAAATPSGSGESLEGGIDQQPAPGMSTQPFALVTMSALEIYNESIRDLGASSVSTDATDARAGRGALPRMQSSSSSSSRK